VTSRAELGDQFIELLATLMHGGYVLARRHPETGALEALTPYVIDDEELGRYKVSDSAGVISDDMEVSVADAYRYGVIRAASYTAVRMKLMRSRNLHPDITPKWRARGSETLYRVGDLRAWQDEYDRRSRAGNFRVDQGKEDVQLDALSVLLGKIREGE
jgi:hypothetical protein